LPICMCGFDVRRYSPDYQSTIRPVHAVRNAVVESGIQGLAGCRRVGESGPSATSRDHPVTNGGRFVRRTDGINPNQRCGYNSRRVSNGMKDTAAISMRKLLSNIFHRNVVAITVKVLKIYKPAMNTMASSPCKWIRNDSVWQVRTPLCEFCPIP
jgi:hypothetical protein